MKTSSVYYIPYFQEAKQYVFYSTNMYCSNRKLVLEGFWITRKKGDLLLVEIKGKDFFSSYALNIIFNKDQFWKGSFFTEIYPFFSGDECNNHNIRAIRNAKHMLWVIIQEMVMIPNLWLSDLHQQPSVYISNIISRTILKRTLSVKVDDSTEFF